MKKTVELIAIHLETRPGDALRAAFEIQKTEAHGHARYRPVNPPIPVIVTSRLTRCRFD